MTPARNDDDIDELYLSSEPAPRNMYRRPFLTRYYYYEYSAYDYYDLARI